MLGLHELRLDPVMNGYDIKESQRTHTSYLVGIRDSTI